MALAGGGENFRVRNMSDLTAMAESLDRLEPNPSLRPPLELWKPLWHWPASLALVVLVLLTLKRRL
jgi:Ca-activated chloride channel family protein